MSERKRIISEMANLLEELDSMEPQERRCPKCGVEASLGDRFCRKCGHPLDKGTKPSVKVRKIHLNI